MTSKKTTTTGFETKVSTYDRVSSMLVALVILCGLVAGIMFVMWWVRNISFDKPDSEIPAAFELTGPGALAEGVASDFEEPGVEELADVVEPQLTDAVAALTDVVSTVQSRFADVEGTAELMGSGTGQGDVRGTGPGGGGDNSARQEWERWKVNYITTNIGNYSQQLDYFKIELASFHRSLDTIEYASNLTKPAPDNRSGVRALERGRVAFSWKQGSQLREFDATLLQRAGIPTDGSRVIIQLLPAEVHAKLLSLELASLDRQNPKRNLDQVLFTYFGVRRAGTGYEFFVEGHEFM